MKTARYHCWAVLSILAFGSWSAPAADPAEHVLSAEPGVSLAEFVFETAPFPSCHAATIAEVDDALVCAFFGGTAERNPDVCIWVSRKENSRSAWTAPVKVADGVQSDELRYPTWNPVLFLPSGGELMLFYKVGPKPSAWLKAI